MEILPLVALNGDSGTATLDVKLDGSGYGIYVPDLGELYGTAVPVTASEGTDWPHFYYGDNEIDPERTAASQDWYGEFAESCYNCRSRNVLRND